MRSLVARNAVFALGTPARGKATFKSWNERDFEDQIRVIGLERLRSSLGQRARRWAATDRHLFGVRGTMDADLMITIAFCLYVSLGSLAVVTLVAPSIRDDTTKAAEAKRRPAGGEPAERITQRRSA
jgi:hypothetical protein